MDATGFWSGAYWYFTPHQPVVPFLANIDDSHGKLTGSISVPDVYFNAPVRLEAFVLGGREGNKVQFAKVYDGSGPFAHRIDYSGIISEDGSSMSGDWHFSGEFGGFKMTREILGDEEKIKQQAKIDIMLEVVSK